MMKGADRITFGVHCHNDTRLGRRQQPGRRQAGARQVECTVNGIGERAGNCSMEELVDDPQGQKDLFDCDTQIVYGSDLPFKINCSPSLPGWPVQPNKAIVGANSSPTSRGFIKTAS